ncbi:AAA-ATPase At3g50940-like [Punica granatum]|uniref:AAA+ ATPase domain-containing protein n=2 Tax=Punica granatum TaxID=22663 RepID=A0A218W1L8_PUNGR|nr:AAA-ATPase At3g50940-like [Punica granatum]OWM66433.1 hypothetical protein CDL15_Pgr013650 [Punica granatum]PKI34639.1 hypothetical protein CRG98_044953 [Punica granatum]
MGAVLSVAASVTILRGTIRELIPEELRGYLSTLIRQYSSDHTMVVRETHEETTNHLFDCITTYLGGGPLALLSATGPAPRRLTAGKNENLRNLTYGLDRDSDIVDSFHGVPLRWKYCSDYNSVLQSEISWYELRFHKKHMKLVRNQYLPHILETAKIIKDSSRVLKFHTVRRERWSYNPVKLSHPMTFETLAMDGDEKKDLIRDLEAFMNGREYYRRIGKVWKRGYLLHGPPGTGKSSLIAAMANFLNYDIYNLNLSTVQSDSVLEYLLLHVSNRSILVVEDIDCSIKLQNREAGDEPTSFPRAQLTLAGILNAIDGLLSCCGEERVIVFTTNYKDLLDPALLRAGRMDKHICLSYCRFSTFKQLASNYLGVSEHNLFSDIEKLLEQVNVTPAEVAGELMKSKDSKASLEGLIKFIEKKISDPASPKEEGRFDANLSQVIDKTQSELEGFKKEMTDLQKKSTATENKLVELKAVSEKLAKALRSLK